jgi:hypothetical protein
MEISWGHLIGDIKIFMKIFCWIIKKHYYFFLFEKNQKTMKIQFQNFILSHAMHHDDFFLVYSSYISFFINYLRYLLEINLFIFFLVHGTFRCRVHNHGKRDKTYWVPCIWITCHWRRVLHEVLFSFMKAKTSTHVMVRGVVRSSGNVKRSWICSLVFFYALVGN